MTQFDNYYSQNKPIVHETNIVETINLLNKFVDSREEEDMLSKASSFLDSDEIKVFMEDSLKNFIYKKVFNLAFMLNKKNKEELNKEQNENQDPDIGDLDSYNKFINDFKNLFESKFNYPYKNDTDTNLDDLAKEFYKLTSSPEKARDDKFTSKLRDHAKDKKIDRCYLCGKTVDLVKKSTDVNLSDSLEYIKKINENPNSSKSKSKSFKKDSKYIENYRKEIKDFRTQIVQKNELESFFNNKTIKQFNYILNKNSTEKLDFVIKNDINHNKENYYNKIIEELDDNQINQISNILKKDENDFTNKHFKKVNMNRLNSMFKDTHHFKNNDVCEIEHNFPAQWGGDLSNSNLFIACHDCNNKKGNIAFYTDVDYSSVFANSSKLTNISGSINAETRIALKIKQKFKCKDTQCNNILTSNKKFYILSEKGNNEIDFFNLSIYCEDCVENNFAMNKKISKEEFITENCIEI